MDELKIQAGEALNLIKKSVSINPEEPEKHNQGVRQIDESEKEILSTLQFTYIDPQGDKI